MLLGGISRCLYRSCDHLVVVTGGIRDRLRDRYGIPEWKISVVENAIETDTFKPGDDMAEIRERWSVNSDFAVSYIGTLGFSHGLHTLLQAAKLMQNEIPPVLFLLMGDGAEKRSLVEEAQCLNLKNVRFLPLQPRDSVPAFIQASNACVVLLKDAEIFHSALPTKMLESMACGRPVVAAVDGVARQVLQDSGAGLFVKPEDPIALMSAIKRLARDPELCRNLGANGRKYVLKHFGRRKKAEAYSRILERVIAPSAHFSSVHSPSEFSKI
jgi:glycosyltransferase involved in cell wall biosynthesis